MENNLRLNNNFFSELKRKLKKYKNKIIKFVVNLIGIVVAGYLILKLSISFLLQSQYKDPIKDYIMHSKYFYKLSLSLSENDKVKKYINNRNLESLKNFLSQFFLPNENIKIEIYNSNFVKFVDMPSYEENNRGLFKVSKDLCLQKVLSAGIGGYFLKPGEYGFEFSGINPVYYNGQIIGLIEVKQIYDGPVVIPKIYKEYIKYAPIKDIGNYVVINSKYDIQFLKKLIKEGKIFENGKYIFLKKFKDYYFIYQVDLRKFLIIFLSTYISFSILYLILIWKYLFDRKTEYVNIYSLSQKLKSIPYIIFSEDGLILAMNIDKWKYYIGYSDKFKTILNFIKKLKLKNPLNFYENYFKNSDSYKEVSLKLGDRKVKFKIFPISNNLRILFLEDLTEVYKRISKLKKEKDHLEDLVNDLKVLLKAKNNKIAELKLQLYFLKQKKNAKNYKNSD